MIIDHKRKQKRDEEEMRDKITAERIKRERQAMDKRQRLQNDIKVSLLIIKQLISMQRKVDQEANRQVIMRNRAKDLKDKASMFFCNSNVKLMNNLQEKKKVTTP